MITLGRIKLSNPIITSFGSLAFSRGYEWGRTLYHLGLIKPGVLGVVITKNINSRI